MSSNFKKYRMKTGLTQEEAAIKLEIHPTTLNKYERGSRYPSGRVLAAMSKLYDVRLDALISGGSQALPQRDELKEKLTMAEEELLVLYRENKSLKDELERLKR